MSAEHADFDGGIPMHAPREHFDPVGVHLQDPYSYLARARREEPVFYSQELGYWFVTRYDDVAAVLRDVDTFSSKDTIPQHNDYLPARVREVLTDYRRTTAHLINSDPPTHTRLRMIMNQGFSPPAVRDLEPTVRAVADSLLDELAPLGTADLSADFAYPLALTIVLRLLGVPSEDVGTCGAWAHDLATLSWGWAAASEDELVSCAQGVVASQRYVEALVAARWDHPGDDLVSRILHAGVRGHAALTPDEVVLMIPGLIVAGHETTANLICNTLAVLLRDPGGIERLRSRTDDLAPIVEEGARLDASLFGTPRTVMRDTKVGEVPVPAGAKLFLLFTSANHDETKYRDAASFSLDREAEPPHLAFGRGIHHCIGAGLARLETRIALERVITRLPDLRMRSDAVPTRRRSLLFRGVERLDVCWTALDC